MQVTETRLKKALAEAAVSMSVANIEFTKENGETRRMTATRSQPIIEAEFGPLEESTRHEGNNVVVLDMEIGEWRSFSPERLNYVNGVDFQVVAGNIINKMAD